MFTAYYVLTNKEALVFSWGLEPQMRPWVLMPAVSAVIGRTLELDQLGNSPATHGTGLACRWILLSDFGIMEFPF